MCQLPAQLPSMHSWQIILEPAQRRFSVRIYDIFTGFGVSDVQIAAHDVGYEPDGRELADRRQEASENSMSPTRLKVTAMKG